MNVNIRTDLALEINENIDQSDSRYKGIIVNEIVDDKTQIKVTVLEIVNKNGEKILNRPMGAYITIEAEELGCADEEYGARLTKILSHHIEELVKPYTSGKKDILVVGLGNREVTADSLGPDVIDKLGINSHLREGENDETRIAAICPGVMAQTGMETADIIKGVVKITKPAVVIAIDALAARNANRLNTTIQLSDRGINPGSGVGNHRVGITKENIGVPVVAIGVPTVIDAPTIVYDAIDTFLTSLSEVEGLEGFEGIMELYTEDEKYALAKEVVSPAMAEMYVTPKDIDCNVQVIGSIIADSINLIAG